MDRHNLTNYFLGTEYEPDIRRTLPAYANKKPTILRTRPPTRRSLAAAKENAAKNTYARTLRSGKRLRNNTTVSINTKDTKKVKKPNLSLVKFMKNIPVSVSKTNIAKAKKFQETIDKLPIYFLNAHACICDLTGPCHGNDINPFFSIPNDTYLLTFGTPPDFSCLTENAIPLLQGNLQSIRKFLGTHSAANVTMAPEIGKSVFSMFSDLKRATQSIDGEQIMYPNINYSFNDKEAKSPEENKYGVYRLDVPEHIEKVNNTMSLISQNPEQRNWFLADIIQEVYKKTGIKKGIFINGGCLSSCTQVQSGPHMDKAGELMNYAHTIYPTLRETLTADEMKLIGTTAPFNRGLYGPFTFENPAEIKAMVNANLLDPKAVANLNKMYHPENAAAIKELK